eukprot:TRINITY_DN53628_c0_g1_i1.p1 TRINITY_DN53628_c0_g1~~TRINITY_DN53628_c0_g1_i1.p1  ORF type:complete len:170 (-),score=32.72 TRINITY_DN53628_c0_g1_i1:11-520(-)
MKERAERESELRVLEQRLREMETSRDEEAALHRQDLLRVSALTDKISAVEQQNSQGATAVTRLEDAVTVSEEARRRLGDRIAELESELRLAQGQCERLQKDFGGSEEELEASMRRCANYDLSLIHISEPTRLLSISYAVFCLKKKKKTNVHVKTYVSTDFNMLLMLTKI